MVWKVRSGVSTDLRTTCLPLPDCGAVGFSSLRFWMPGLGFLASAGQSFGVWIQSVGFGDEHERLSTYGSCTDSGGEVGEVKCLAGERP